MMGIVIMYLLDIVRLCLVLLNYGYNGMMYCFGMVYRIEGVGAFYKGFGSTLVGIVFYVVINFVLYDMVKKMYYGENGKEDRVFNLVVGGVLGMFSVIVCYSFDIIRRRM